MNPANPKDDDTSGPLGAITLDRFAALLNEPTTGRSLPAGAPTKSAGARKSHTGLARSEPELHWSERIVVWGAGAAIAICIAVFVYFIYVA